MAQQSSRSSRTTIAGEGQRGAGQVLACSSLPSASRDAFSRVFVRTDGPLSLGVGELQGASATGSLSPFVAFFACCAGDNVAAGCGILSKGATSSGPPKPWRVAKPGTNGGVSVAGDGLRAVARCVGLCHATLFMFTAVVAARVAALAYVGLWVGLSGSLVDSLPGATVQARNYLLFDEKQTRDRERRAASGDACPASPSAESRDGSLRLDGARRVDRARRRDDRPPLRGGNTSLAGCNNRNWRAEPGRTRRRPTSRTAAVRAARRSAPGRSSWTARRAWRA